MGIADVSLAIDNAIQRHASQLEQVHFLPVDSGDAVVGIGKAGEGDVFLHPVLLKRRG